MAPFDEQEMKPMVVTEGVAAPAAAAAPRLSPLKVTLWCLVVALAGMAFMVTRIHAPTGSLRASAFPACQGVDCTSKGTTKGVATTTDPDTTITSTVYLDIAIDNKYSGRVLIGLYGNEVPLTTENFRALCTGEKGMGTMGEQLSYLGTPFHRIIPEFMIQGGDITSHDGYGGESIYGKTFDDENFNIKFDKVGLVAMANAGPDTQGSQFFITTTVTSWLNGMHVVFGEVTDNYDLVKTVEALGSSSGTPSKTVTIMASGVYDASAPAAVPSTEEPAAAAAAAAATPKKNSYSLPDRPEDGSGAPPAAAAATTTTTTAADAVPVATTTSTTTSTTVEGATPKKRPSDGSGAPPPTVDADGNPIAAPAASA